MAKSKSNGGVRSPMTGFQQQESHRVPSTAGTTEMVGDMRVNKPAPIQSPQTPFGIRPNEGRKPPKKEN